MWRFHGRRPSINCPAPWLIAGIVLGLAGCSSLEHANPFDPDNLQTFGRPKLIVAAAGDSQVVLDWTIPALTDLVAVQMIRLDEQGLRVVLPLDPMQVNNQYVDRPLPNLDAEHLSIRQAHRPVATPR